MMTFSGVGKAKAEIVGVRVLLLLMDTCNSTEDPLKYHITIVNSYFNFNKFQERSYGFLFLSTYMNVLIFSTAKANSAVTSVKSAKYKGEIFR